MNFTKFLNLFYRIIKYKTVFVCIACKSFYSIILEHISVSQLHFNLSLTLLNEVLKYKRFHIYIFLECLSVAYTVFGPAVS